MNRHLIAISLLLALSSGCAQNTALEAEPAAPKPALRALGESIVIDEARNDETIGLAVRRRMDVAGPADTAGIVVEVENAVVTLRGTAPNLPAAWRAEAAARSVAGVKEVINEILVTSPGP